MSILLVYLGLRSSDLDIARVVRTQTLIVFLEKKGTAHQRHNFLQSVACEKKNACWQSLHFVLYACIRL